MSNENVPSKPKRSGSKVLLQITALVLVVSIVSALVTFFIYRGSINNLIEKSKKDLVATQASAMGSSFSSLAGILNDLILDNAGGQYETAQLFLNSIQTKTPTQSTLEANAMIKDIIKTGIVGDDGVIFVVIPEFPPVIKKPMVLISSEDSLMFADVPDELFNAFTNGKNFCLLENGVPEWGFENEQLLVFEEIESGYGGMGLVIYGAGLRSMNDDITQIYNTYNKERNRINTLIGLVIACSLILLFIATFFILRYLIHSKITKPMDELAATAEQVMEGDVDVEVPVRKGEEFENLKRTFNEMLKAIRAGITGSSDE
ncbi:MAG: HAMP domain-containing protein [Actinobacteria bacterium]|nr:HAMP domain-containing protein [Actinomycetota bacterium]